MASGSAERVLMNEYKSLMKEPWTNIEVRRPNPVRCLVTDVLQLINENIFEWSVALIVLNPDSVYYGGYFKAKMKFPKNYPYTPPDFSFNRPLFHPNIYPDGRLCISILHPPGEDEMAGETAAERWSPVQRVESVLISILSLLDDPEVSSPANVDAGVMLREDPAAYKEKVKTDLAVSKKDIPEGYVMPTHETAFKSKQEPVFDADDWADSDADDFDGSDFGGSESDMEMEDADDSDNSDDS